MRLLFNIAFFRKSHWGLITTMIISMLCLTVTTQMEIISLGVLSKKGPAFFELFGPMKNGHLEETDVVSFQDLTTRFKELDTQGNGTITRSEVSKYLQKKSSRGLVETASQMINKYIPIYNSPLYLAILVFCIAIVNALAMFWYRFTTKLIAIKVSKDLRQSYFEHIQSLPMSFYQDHNIGGLSARVVTDALAIAEGINATLINYLKTPFTVASTLAICFIVSWKLSLVIFFGFPLIAIPIIIIARHVKRIAKQLQKNQENFTSTLIDFLAGVQTVKVFAMENFSLKKYREQNERMAFLERKSAKYDMSSRPIVHTITMMLLSAAILIGLYVLQMSVPEVLVYCGMLYVFYEPIKRFAETNAMIQRGAAAAERMHEVLQIKPQIEDAQDAIAISSFEHAIEFRNIWFKYNDFWVIKDLSFTIKKGETVAIVGPTGAGKSTIVQLLPRLYDVNRGEILIDGKPLNTYTQRSVRDLIAFVPQKPFLFLDTIAENIAFGRDYTFKEISDAAKNAHAIDFIQALPKGFETELSETGKNLSGGQQQRLAIARALFKKAPILVLDEATSSLDAVSEHHIKMAVHDLKGKMTQVIIAHRLSTVEDADKIIFLDNGKKLAEGTKEELLKNCPPFKLMWELMQKGEKVPV